HARRAEVQDHRIEVAQHRQVQAGDAVGGEVDGVPAILQVVAAGGGAIGVVFDDEDAPPDSCAGLTEAALILAYGLVNARMQAPPAQANKNPGAETRAWAKALPRLPKTATPDSGT